MIILTAHLEYNYISRSLLDYPNMLYIIGRSTRFYESFHRIISGYERK